MVRPSPQDHGLEVYSYGFSPRDSSSVALSEHPAAIVGRARLGGSVWKVQQKKGSKTAPVKFKSRNQTEQERVNDPEEA
jgi:hypothetical protein